MDTIFANNLKKLRTQKGISQLKLAKELNVSPQRYAQWETGKAYPRIPVLLQICDLFQYYNLHELLTVDISKIYYETTQSTQ